MRPFTRSIIELFDSKRRYLIPLYQRQYAWKVKPQLELLWADIEASADRLEKSKKLSAPHFMGAIVISQIKTFGKQVQAFEVIDGQQRLTTFQLLLTSLRDVAKESSPEYSAEVSKHLLNEGVMENIAFERFKLWPSLIDRSAFTKLVDPHGIGAPSKYLMEDDGDFVRLAPAAYDYFCQQIRARVYPKETFDAFRMEKLFEALKDGLAVVSIELEGGDEPQTIFETLNSRGVDLSAGDLMRNFIFQRASGMGQQDGSLLADELYEKYWLPLDRSFWRALETRGRLTRPRIDWMLVDYLTMKVADTVSAESLYESYRNWINGKKPFLDVSAELSAIDQTSKIFQAIVDQNNSTELGRFGRFAKAFDVSTAMPLVIYLATDSGLKKDKLGSALHLIQSYIVRRDMCGLTTKSYNRFFVEAIDKLRKSKRDKIVELRSILSSGMIDTSRWPDDVELQREWQSRSQYKSARQPRLRYIFEKIEASKRAGQDEIVEIKTDLTLEHILPQKWREHWSLPATAGLKKDEFDLDLQSRSSARDALINLMGNLTLLTQALNSSVSNGPFSIKMPALRAQSALVLNRELQNYSTWDENRITARGAQLLTEFQKIWPGPSLPTG